MHTHIEDTLVSLDRAELNGEVARLSAKQAEIFGRAKLRLADGDVGSIAAIQSLLDARLSMPAYRFDDAVAAVAKLAKKAAKRGLPIPTIEEVSRETRTTDAGDQEWVTVRLLGAAPVLNGWSCLAVMVPRQEGGEWKADVCTATGVDVDPAWLVAPQRCDHCNTNRKRAFTFVVEHTDATVKQVGKTCLNEYIGADALASWFVFSELREVEQDLRGWGYDHHAAAAWYAEHAEDAAKKARGPKVRPACELFLAAVAASVRVQAFDRLTGRDVYDRLVTAEHEAVTEADLALAAQALAWVAALTPEGYVALARYPARTVDCVRAALERGHANKSEAGPISYLLGMTQAAGRVNEPVPGAVPGRTIEVALTFDRVLRWAIQCTDRAGRVVLIKSFASGSMLLTMRRMEQDTTFTVTARVQSIGEYRGTVQTILVGAEVAFEGE